MTNKNKFGLTDEQIEKINIPRKISTIKTLIINDCYGVPDKLKFGLTEGWDFTKHYLILADSEEAFMTLKTAFEDIFINFHLNTIDTNERSGIGINEDLFSGKLTDEDIEYIPQLKKYLSSKTTALFKFHKQSIVITTNPKEIFCPYGGNKYLTINDIGFFTLRENTDDFIAQLKDYSSFINLAEEKKLKGEALLDWIYRNIMDGRFLFKPEITLTQQVQKNLTKTEQEIKREKLMSFTNTIEFLNKDIPSMEDVVNDMHEKTFKNMAAPITIEADYTIEEDSKAIISKENINKN